MTLREGRFRGCLKYYFGEVFSVFSQFKKVRFEFPFVELIKLHVKRIVFHWLLTLVFRFSLLPYVSIVYILLG